MRSLSARLATKRWKLAHPEKNRETHRIGCNKRYHRQWLADPIWAAAGRMLNSISDRARLAKMPVAPEMRMRGYIAAWIREQPNCACCGVAWHLFPKNGMKNDASPSIDQLAPGAGYLLDNISLICWRCNNIKRNYSAADLQKVAAWILGREKGES